MRDQDCGQGTLAEHHLVARAVQRAGHAGQMARVHGWEGGPVTRRKKCKRQKKEENVEKKIIFYKNKKWNREVNRLKTVKMGAQTQITN